MGYLNDVPQSAGAPEDDARSIAEKASVAFRTSAGAVMPDKSYVGFVDSKDGFDGGDGQMGVVGDGQLAMEHFDTREVLLRDGSGPQTSVQVSLHSGQKPILPLAMKGKTGEMRTGTEEPTTDKGTKVQRQLYENWGQQQRQRTVERGTRAQMEAVASGAVYKSAGHVGGSENVLPGGCTSAILDKLLSAPVEAGKVDGQLEIKGRGLVSILVETNSMVSEHFCARFTEDSGRPFVVAEDSHTVGGRSVAGLLPRRGTDKELVVRFDPDGAVSQTMVQPAPESSPRLPLCVLEVGAWFGDSFLT